MPLSRLLAMARAHWKRWLLEALLVVAVVFGVQLWQARDLPQGPAPTLTGTTTDGRAVSLAATLAAANNRPVLVAFWASWCPVCKAEEGNVIAVARDWPTLTVAMQSGNAAEVAKHLKERGLSFEAVVDGDGALAATWQVRGVPTHFVVDANGIVRFRLVGYATEWGLRARLWWAQRFPV